MSIGFWAKYLEMLSWILWEFSNFCHIESVVAIGINENTMVQYRASVVGTVRFINFDPELVLRNAVVYYRVTD